MANLKHSLLIAAFTGIIFGCKNEPKPPVVETQSVETAVEKPDFTGNYVTESYDQRTEGYDWVAVTVTPEAGDQLKISVRSRADKKKPTCTFDATVQRFDDSTYSTRVDDKVIRFRFGQNSLRIEPESQDGESILYFYCSGGASLAGTYQKINEALDQNQIDKTQFSKVLNLQGVGFNVSAIEKNGTNELSIFTFGLPVEFKETFAIENQAVQNAEVEDLNSDGSPELLVFTKENGTNGKGQVYAFSVNNKKSMSAVYLPPTEENEKINKGYQGGDEFALVETNLVQRFPIFKNGTETGKIRQVSYTLKNGENSRIFVVDRIDEF
ncbi:hypothetical protein C943_04390 [Mariniradius saccharolyticus AK6]|uniref:Uncharacterized protein n=1 Tax=Mariniradius saccharolyticus AK6 TaxID=1239962 RepID=M7XYF0_9BACT|nr:hypothetical protein [Mariniradius saccharolyticus]EMS33512.1 hypothetical protein C943_04390 [Mariniradius saccharolyticus AK6]